ncbi:hypothetical protein QFZ28_003035 [Neobacillus niacini]|uniref:hypothetical protein n=1 Tax=Neobacillus niacini TaxID=86668 RepID=UPI00277F7D5E|nr:hypothetical protein [Neobacillus niacini]MDQ1002635.1 hypothetical protein [Neobacillus niacini]
MNYKRQEIIETYNEVGIVWKVTDSKNVEESHLKKRQRRKELSEDWTLDNYNDKIINIINGLNNDVHVYYSNNFSQDYFCFNDEKWIVIIGKYNVMEIALIGNPQNYFTNNEGYTYLGKVKDVFE